MTSLLRSVIVSLIFSIASTAGAVQYSVTGNVRDSIGSPESFATVRIYLMPDSIKPKTSGITGENGDFNISLPQAGDYKVNIISFGKSDINRNVSVSDAAPVAKLGNLIMSATTSLLKEVVVTAQRPLVTKEIDRIGYDVQADEESKTSQLDEILKKVPLVSVDPDGTIKIKGSTDFKVYKNGRPNNSFSRNAKDIFKAIPASMIKKIEVITDPGSREDAEGTAAILNIVTMDNTVIKGVMGNVNLSYTTNDNHPDPRIWLSTQIDKVNLSLYAGYNGLSRRSRKNSQESLHLYEDSGNELYNESQGTSHGNVSFFGLDGSFELDSLNLFSAEFGGYTYSLKSESFGTTSMKDANGQLIYAYNDRWYMPTTTAGPHTLTGISI